MTVKARAGLVPVLRATVERCRREHKILEWIDVDDIEALLDLLEQAERRWDDEHEVRLENLARAKQAERERGEARNSERLIVEEVKAALYTADHAEAGMHPRVSLRAIAMRLSDALTVYEQSQGKP